MVIQILITLCSLIVLFKAFKTYRKKEVRFSTFFVWSLFWIFAILLLWQPNLSNYLAHFLQVTRGADALFYLAFVFIFYLLFRLVVRFERLDSEVTTLVKDIALLERKVQEKEKGH